VLLRFLVFLLLAIGLGGFGTVAWLSMRPPPKPPIVAMAAPPPPPRRLILVAAAPLHAGTLVKPEDLLALQVASIPAGAQEDTQSARAGLIGAMIRHSLAPNDPLLAADVIRPGDHGFLAAVLGADKSAASVGVDSVSGNAGLIWPGDHVDLILTQTLDTPNLPAGHHVAAETVLSDVRVIAVDQLLARGVAPAAEAAGIDRTVTLEVTREQAERINVATRLGRLSLAVRSADQTAPQPGSEPLRTIWAGDVSPALRRPKSSTSSTALLRLYQGAADGKEFRF
jgi:pilus assembly protein CpaB